MGATTHDHPIVVGADVNSASASTAGQVGRVLWDEGFLPSEAEWEYAAAGGSQQREYPWGNAPPGTQSQYAIYDWHYPTSSGTCTGIANIAPVGMAALGAGLWGQVDIAGEESVWTADWYSPNYVSPCKDCAYLSTASDRIVRGGFYDDVASVLVPTSRLWDTPADRDHENGVRCGRSP